MNRSSKQIFIILALLLAAIGIVVVIMGNLPKKVALSSQARSALDREMQHYGNPLERLGFTEGLRPRTSCKTQALGGELTCTASIHAEKTFSDDKSKRELIKKIENTKTTGISWGYNNDMQIWFEKALAVADGYDVTRAKNMGPYLQFKNFEDASCYFEFVTDKRSDSAVIKIYAEFRCTAPTQQHG